MAWTCFSLTTTALVFLLFISSVVSFDAFDTHDVSDNGEMIYMTITDSVIDRRQPPLQQQPRPRSPPTGSGTQDFPINNNPTYDTDAMMDRLQRHPKVTDQGSLPGRLGVSFLCRGQPMQLDLRHYHDNHLARGREDFVTRNGFDGRLNARAGTVSGNVEDIPVFTRSADGRSVVVDDFPRIYGSNCRTFRDYNNGAYFLAIKDPEFSSYKFVGSFVMNGDRFFVEPYSTGNSSSTTSTTGVQRAHVSTRLPPLNYADDIGVLSLPENLKLKTTGNRVNTAQRKDTTQILSNPDTKIALDNKIDSQNIVQETDKKQKSRKRNKGRNNDESDGLDTLTSRARRRNQATTRSRGRGKRRRKRMAMERYTVELFLVCDYLCYKGFQREKRVTDETATKNAVLQYFTLLQEALKTSYGGIETQQSRLGVAIDVRVVGTYIATTSTDTIIGKYVMNDDNEIDTGPSLFEFAIWVQEGMKVASNADHYVLVTGYDLSGASKDVIGQVTRIPSICKIDSVSVNEFLLKYLSTTIIHELGHSLGAQHDSLTGRCRDRDGFIMAATVNDDSASGGNAGRFSSCSVRSFQTELSALGSDSCLKRNDFNVGAVTLRSQDISRASNFPLDGSSESTMRTQETQMTADEQCGLWFEGSTLCREVHATVSWDSVCVSQACRIPPSSGGQSGMCALTSPGLEFTSCGDGYWCEGGACVRNSLAMTAEVLDCPAGDEPTAGCDARRCASYDDVTRFIDCCNTCRPMKAERFVVFSSF